MDLLTRIEALLGDPALGASFDLFLRISALLCITIALTFVMRRRTSAATRHALLLGSVVGALVLPLLVWVLPSVEISMGGEIQIRTGARSAAPSTVASGIVTVVWTSCALVLLIRLLIGIGCLNRWAARAGLVTDSPWTRMVDLLAAELGIRRHIDVFADDAIEMPATWGLKRPLVLLPVSADAWPDDRRRRVLLHELSHVRRHDCLTQAVAQIACALLWFHPLVWWCERRMRIERESACDAAVVAAGERPSSYAADLLALVREVQAAPTLPHAAVPLGGRSGLETRLRALLSRRGLGEPGTARGAVVAALAGCVTALAAVVTPVSTLRPVPVAAPALVVLESSDHAAIAAIAAIAATPATPFHHAELTAHVVGAAVPSTVLEPRFDSLRTEPASAATTAAPDVLPENPRPTNPKRPSRDAPAPVVPDPAPSWVHLRSGERHLPSTRLHARSSDAGRRHSSTYSFVHETRDDAGVTRNRWDIGLSLEGDALVLHSLARGAGSGIADLGPGALTTVRDADPAKSRLRPSTTLTLGHVYLQHVVHGATTDFWVAIKPFALAPDGSARLTWKIVAARSVPGRVVMPDGSVLPIGVPAGDDDLGLTPAARRLDRVRLRLRGKDKGLIVGRHRPDRTPDLWVEETNGALQVRADVETGRLFDLGVIPIRQAQRTRVRRATPALRLPVQLGRTFVLHLRESHGDQLVRFRIVAVDPAGAVTLARAPMAP